LENKQTLHIGFDDTDSSKSMCTTYLAYKIVNYLQRQGVEFLDYPYLIRLNPNIPWKTRGNGAVALTVKTANPEKIKNRITNLVRKFSDTRRGANPGLVFYQNEMIPYDFVKFSENALWKLISRNHAKKFVSKHKIENHFLGNGQGLVGAISAIGYKFRDHTFELISYRKKSHIGRKRHLIGTSVKEMQEKTYPYTFNSFDLKKNRVLIAPHGPDPVLFGLRGENPLSVIKASKMIKTEEKPEGYMTFKTNQGTGDHLRNEIDVTNFRPYTSGTITGIVSKPPHIEKGGHVFFEITKNKNSVKCAVYRQTKITAIATRLRVGDKICVGGGIRRASKNHPRVLNIEFLEIMKVVPELRFVNPLCKVCNKTMKSKGKNQGFQCIKCKTKSSKKILKKIPRQINAGIYIPAVSAHRHLTRPLQRAGIQNKNTTFDKSIPWFFVYSN
jgi:tRNA(Ile2)-agmatinylcytidine synthase